MKRKTTCDHCGATRQKIVRGMCPSCYGKWKRGTLGPPDGGVALGAPSQGARIVETVDSDDDLEFCDPTPQADVPGRFARLRQLLGLLHPVDNVERCVLQAVHQEVNGIEEGVR